MAVPNTQARPYSQAYNVNGGNAPAVLPTPGAAPLLPNQGRVLQSGPVRVLCIADVRGNLRSLNDLAREAKANYIIHTGDFGFYDNASLDRIAEKTLRHVAQYSPLLAENVKRTIAASPPQPSIKERFSRNELPLSELPLFLNKTFTLDVPVYTVWGACEDVQVLEKLRSGEYKIDNLHIVDEAHSRLLDIGGVKLRLLGLGGAVVMHKLFDNGDGRTTIAGGQGTMWTTLLQMGELIDTATRVYDPTETRIFVTHASPAREGLLNQLSVTLKADFSISAGLHFRYGSSYNEFSVNPTLDHYRGKLAASKASFDDVWQTVKNEVEPAVSENDAQHRLLNFALDLVTKMPVVANGGNPFGGTSAPGSGIIDEAAFKNMWNFNLADAAYGWLVLDIEGGRIGTEMRAQGFNFAHRTGKGHAQQAQVPASPALQPRQLAQTRATPPVVGGRTPAVQPPRVAVSPEKPETPAGGEKPVETKTNGTTAGDKSAENETPTGPQQERRPQPTALFVRYAKDEDEVRSAISVEDLPKVERFEKSGSFYIVHFKNYAEMSDAFKRVPVEHKERQPVGQAPKLNVAIYRAAESRRDWHQGGAGNARGGPVHHAYRGGPGGAGGASDSDTGRGFRGGRGRGGRGTDRGRGRGGALGPAGRGAGGGASAPKEGGGSAPPSGPAAGGDS